MIARKNIVSGLALIFCAACSAPATEKPVAPSVTPEPTDAHFTSYDVKTEPELNALTAAAKQRSPDWTIVLDPFGYLSSAECDNCEATEAKDTRLRPDDRTKVNAFLKAQADLLASDAPYVEKKYDNDTAGLFFTQKTPYGFAGFFHALRSAGRVRVSGHAWPRLPSFTGPKGDDELAATLRKIDPDPQLSLIHAVRTYAPTLSGPLELHAVLCLSNGPCVDAFTGDDMRPLAAGWTVSNTNGRVTERHLTKFAK